MKVSYEKLNKLIDKKGESYNSLFDKGVLKDNQRRLLKNDKYANIEVFANLCQYFNVPIEDIVEVIIDQK